MPLETTLKAKDRRLLFVDADTHWLLKICATYRRMRMFDLVRELARDEARRCGIELDPERD